MAQKKTYIYRMNVGRNNKAETDFFMYARNSKTAIEYCKEIYKDKKYNYFKPIKVGVSLWLRDTGIVSDEEDKKLRNSIAVKSESYSERDFEAPKFITTEEAGDLNL